MSYDVVGGVNANVASNRRTEREIMDDVKGLVSHSEEFDYDDDFYDEKIDNDLADVDELLGDGGDEHPNGKSWWRMRKIRNYTVLAFLLLLLVVLVIVLAVEFTKGDDSSSDDASSASQLNSLSIVALLSILFAILL
jgi:hypothetical protein